MPKKNICRHHEEKFNAKRHEGCAALMTNSYSSVVHSLELSVDVSVTNLMHLAVKLRVMLCEGALHCIHFAGRAHICGVFMATRGDGYVCSTDY